MWYIPIAVVTDNNISCGKVDAEATGVSDEQEDGLLAPRFVYSLVVLIQPLCAGSPSTW
jgi:hypothetical protein